MDGEKVGTVVVACDMAPLYGRLWRYLGLTVGILAAALVVAMITASRLHRTISRPVQTLVDASAEVAWSQDYCLRVDDGGRSDELGTLIRAFNRMLADIQRSRIERG